VNTLTLHSRRSTEQPEKVAEHLRVQGEVQWYLEGSAELIQQAASALAGVYEQITAEMLLVNFGNSVGWFRVPGLGLLEVISGKWESGHFDSMLLDLSVWASALPFSIGAGSVGVEWNAVEQQTVLYHAFVYLRSVLSEHISPERRLLGAIHTVMRDPHRQLERVRREVPLEAVRQVEPSLLEDLAAGHFPLVRLETVNQQQLPFVRRLRGYIPEYVIADQGEITFDTPENRFVKAFLDYALIVISQMRQFIEGISPENRSAFQRCVLEECDRMEYLLRPSRQHALWKEIGSMVHVPVSSTVLQRRQGYREIFGHYSRMLLATKVPLAHKVEQDLLEAKDIAQLYEIWCYFACVRQLELLLGPPVAAGRLEAHVTELTVPWGIAVQWQDGTRLLYNLAFSRSSRRQRYSYSVPLRPDIVLEVPYGPNAGIHVLDAKFKVQFPELLEPPEDFAESGTLTEERQGAFKPEDMYKMHTYLDAIPQARSAWILYPGSKLRFFGREEHTIITTKQRLPQVMQGVGAIPLKPGRERHRELTYVLGCILQR
jgi:predicted component of viral defense system (DUF524 family)